MSVLDRLMPRDLVALLLIVCGTVLKLAGENGTISMVLVGIACSYFGAELFLPTVRK
jgi:hypothetical protein